MSKEILKGIFEENIAPVREDITFEGWVDKIKDNEEYKVGLFENYVQPSMPDATFEDFNAETFGLGKVEAPLGGAQSEESVSPTESVSSEFEVGPPGVEPKGAPVEEAAALVGEVEPTMMGQKLDPYTIVEEDDRNFFERLFGEERYRRVTERAVETVPALTRLFGKAAAKDVQEEVSDLGRAMDFDPEFVVKASQSGLFTTNNLATYLSQEAAGDKKGAEEINMFLEKGAEGKTTQFQRFKTLYAPIEKERNEAIQKELLSNRDYVALRGKIDAEFNRQRVGVDEKYDFKALVGEEFKVGEKELLDKYESATLALPMQLETKANELKFEYQAKVNNGQISVDEANAGLRRDLDAYGAELQKQNDKALEEYNSGVTALAERLEKGVKDKPEFKAYMDELNELRNGVVESFSDDYQKIQQSVFNNVAPKYNSKIETAITNSMRGETPLLDKSGVKGDIAKIVNNRGWDYLAFDQKRAALDTMFGTALSKLKRSGVEINDGVVANLRAEFDDAFMDRAYFTKKGTPSLFMVKTRAIEEAERLDEMLKERKAKTGTKTYTSGIYGSEFGVGGKGYDDTDVQELRLAREKLQEIIDMPETMSDSEWSNFWNGFTSGQFVDYLPFVSGLKNLSGTLALYRAVGKDTESARYLKNAEALNSTYRNMYEVNNIASDWYKAGKGTAQSLPFMMEFAATAGVGSGVRLGTEKVVVKLLGKQAETVVGKSLKVMAGTLISSLAQTTLNPQRYVDEALKRMTPQMTMAFSPEGDDLVAMLDSSDTEGGFEAALKGFGVTASEYFSEGLGFAGARAMKAVGSKMLQNEFLKRAYIGWYMSKFNFDTPTAFKKIAEMGGWNGFLMEFGEELANIPLTNLITGDAKVMEGIIKDGELDTENLADVARTLLPISLAGGAFSLGTLAISKMSPEGVTIRYRDINNLPATETINKGAWDAVTEVMKSPSKVRAFIANELPRLKVEGKGRAIVTSVLERAAIEFDRGIAGVGTRQIAEATSPLEVTFEPIDDSEKAPKVEIIAKRRQKLNRDRTKLVPTGGFDYFAKVGDKEVKLSDAEYKAYKESGVLPESVSAVEVTPEVEGEAVAPEVAEDVVAEETPTLRDVEFTMRRPEKNEIVFVSVDALLEKHAKDQPSYDIQKPENRIKGRVEKAKEFIQKYLKDQRAINPRTGERMKTKVSFEPSVVDFNENGKISFEDGRHRVLAAKELGITEVPIEVPKEKAKEIEELLGKPTQTPEVAEGQPAEVISPEVAEALSTEDATRIALESLEVLPEGIESAEEGARIYHEAIGKEERTEAEDAIVMAVEDAVIGGAVAPEVAPEVEVPNVEELFESKPELANQVYEALGFVLDIKSMFPVVKMVGKFDASNTGAFFSDIDGTLQLPSNFDSLPKEIQELYLKHEFIHLQIWNKFGKNGFYNNKFSSRLFNISKDLYKKYVDNRVFDNDKLDISKTSKRNREILRDIRKSIKNTEEFFTYAFTDKSFADLLKQEGYYDEIVNWYKENVGETIFPEPTSEQKQQAQELYSQYVAQTGRQDIEGFREFVSKSTPEAVETAEAPKPAEGKEPSDAQMETKIEEVSTITQIRPKNLRDLYKVNRELFGQNKIKALASAIVMDRMVGAMAKRSGITKAEMYGRLKFEKASEEFGKGQIPQDVKFQKTKTLSLYHSTSSPIVGEFRMRGKNNSWGAYFSRTKKVSQVFGDITYKVSIKPNNTLVLNDNEVRKYKFFNIPEEQYKKYREDGYDSIAWYKNGKLQEFVVLDPKIVTNSSILYQGEQGAMISEDGKYIIYALTDPNVSTPLHEMAHVFEHYLTPSERNAVIRNAGTNGWTTETSEYFARGFERYLAEGSSPIAELNKVFAKFREWLVEIYNGIVGSDIDIELNPEMRKLYDTIFGETAETPRPAEGLTSKEKAEKYKKEAEEIAKKIRKNFRGRGGITGITPFSRAKRLAEVDRETFLLVRKYIYTKVREAIELSKVYTFKDFVEDMKENSKRIFGVQINVADSDKSIFHSASSRFEIDDAFAQEILDLKQDFIFAIAAIPGRMNMNFQEFISSNSALVNGFVNRAESNYGLNQDQAMMLVQEMYQDALSAAASRAESYTTLEDVKKFHETKEELLALERDMERARINEEIKRRRNWLSRNFDRFKRAFITPVKNFNRAFEYRGGKLSDYRTSQERDVYSARKYRMGASTKANNWYNAIHKKIYGDLSWFEKVELDKYLIYRRIVEVTEIRNQRKADYKDLEDELAAGVTPVRAEEIAKLMAELEEAGIGEVESGSIMVDGKKEEYTVAIAEAFVSDINARNDALATKIKERAEMYTEANNELLKMRLDAGLISQEAYDSMEKRDYVRRLFVDISNTTVDEANYSPVSKEIKAIKKGSKDMILEMDTQALLQINAQITFDSVAKNKFMQKVAEWTKNKQQQYLDKALEKFKDAHARKERYLRSSPRPLTQEEIDKFKKEQSLFMLHSRNKAKPVGFELVPYFVNGKEKILAVRNDIANVFQTPSGRGVKENSFAIKALSAILLTPVIKASAVFVNPAFAIGNFALDVIHASMVTRDLYKSFTFNLGTILAKATGYTAENVYRKAVKFGASLFGRTARDSKFERLVKDYFEHGGGMSGLANPSSRMYSDKLSSSALRRSFGDAKDGIIAVLDVINSLQAGSELITRVVVYEAALEKNITAYREKNGVDPVGEDLALMKMSAAASAADLIDFREGTETTKVLDQTILPFLNAMIQGAKAEIDFASKNPLLAAARLAEFGGMALGVALYNANSGDEDEKENIVGYNGISEYIKSNYFIMMMPWTKKNERGEIVRPFISIKLPAALKATNIMITGMVADQGAKNTIGQMVSALEGGYVPEIGAVSPTAQIAMALSTNKDAFRKGAPIYRGRPDVLLTERFNAGETKAIYRDLFGAMYDLINEDGENEGVLGFDEAGPAQWQAAFEKAISPNNPYYLGITSTYAAISSLYGKENKREVDVLMDEKFAALNAFRSRVYREPNSSVQQKNIEDRKKIDFLRDQIGSWQKKNDDAIEFAAKTIRDFKQLKPAERKFMIDKFFDKDIFNYISDAQMTKGVKAQGIKDIPENIDDIQDFIKEEETRLSLRLLEEFKPNFIFKHPALKSYAQSKDSYVGLNAEMINKIAKEYDGARDGINYLIALKFVAGDDFKNIVEQIQPNGRELSTVQNITNSQDAYKYKKVYYRDSNRSSNEVSSESALNNLILLKYLLENE